MEFSSVSVSDDYLKALEKILSTAKRKDELYEAIVNVPFIDKFQTTQLGLGFLAFLLVNKQTGMIDRISISNTDTAQGAINMTVKPFHDMKVPIGYKGNIVATAIKTGRYQQTTDWHHLTDPTISAEDSRFNQAAAGISSSIVYPIIKTNPGGAIIFQYYIDIYEVGTPQHDFMFRYIKLVSSILNKYSGLD